MCADSARKDSFSRLLPAVGLPNLAAVILFGAALAALLIWRNHRRNELAEKRPWRDVIEK